MAVALKEVNTVKKSLLQKKTKNSQGVSKQAIPANVIQQKSRVIQQKEESLSDNPIQKQSDLEEEEELLQGKFSQNSMPQPWIQKKAFTD